MAKKSWILWPTIYTWNAKKANDDRLAELEGENISTVATDIFYLGFAVGNICRGVSQQEMLEWLGISTYKITVPTLLPEWQEYFIRTIEEKP